MPGLLLLKLASPGWSSGLGPTNLRSFLNQRAVPQRTFIGWEQDGRRMLGPSLPKSSWADMKVSLCVLQLTALTDLKSIRNGTVLLIPEHAARFVLPLMPPLLSLLRKFLCTPGGNSQASVLCQGFPASPGRSASLALCLFTASNSFSYRISSRLWLGLRYRLTFLLGYIGSMQQWDWELGSVLRHRVN